MSRQLAYTSIIGERNLGVVGIWMTFQVRNTYYLPDIGSKAVAVNQTKPFNVVSIIIFILQMWQLRLRVK